MEVVIPIQLGYLPDSKEDKEMVGFIEGRVVGTTKGFVWIILFQLSQLKMPVVRICRDIGEGILEVPSPHTPCPCTSGRESANYSMSLISLFSSTIFKQSGASKAKMVTFPRPKSIFGRASYLFLMFHFLSPKYYFHLSVKYFCIVLLLTIEAGTFSYLQLSTLHN